MARPRKTIRWHSKTLSISEEIIAQVDLLLYSDVEGRVPFGAWKAYVEDLIKKDLRARQQKSQGQTQRDN